MEVIHKIGRRKTARKRNEKSMAMKLAAEVLAC